MIKGVLRSPLRICGLPVPLSINGMSIFCLNLSLYRGTNYTSSSHQMEDSLSTIRWSLITGSR